MGLVLGGEDGDAVFVSFAGSNEDLVVGEVDVLDAEFAALLQAKTGAVEEAGHEFGDSFEGGEEGVGFLGAQDGGEMFGSFCADEVLELGEGEV